MSAVAASMQSPVNQSRSLRRPAASRLGVLPSTGAQAPFAKVRKDADEQLVREAQAGSGHAFELLVWKHQAWVLKLTRGFVGEADAPEAFIKCHRALQGFRFDSAFSTWLHTITVNCCRNHLAARRRRPSGQDIDAADAEHSGFADKLSDHETPERSALADEVGDKLNRALHLLPQDLREALIMRERDGLSYEEIAEVMDCPIGTVRSRIFRAREAIDAVVQPLLDD